MHHFLSRYIKKNEKKSKYKFHYLLYYISSVLEITTKCLIKNLPI